MKRKSVAWVAGSILLFLFVLAVTVGVYLVAANTVPPAAVVPPALPVPNAFDEYVAAAMAVQEPKDLYVGRGLISDMTVLRKVAADNRETLAQLRAAFRHEYMTPPRYGFSAAFPELARFRSTARVLAAEGRLAEREGRYGDAARSYLDCIRMGSNVPRGGPLIHYLVGVAIQAIGTVPLQRSVDHLDAATAKRAARELARLDGAAPSAADALLRERDWSLMSQRDMFRKHRYPQEYIGLISGGSGSGSGSNIQEQWDGLALFFWSKSDILRNYSRYMDAVVNNMRQPYYAHPPDPPYPPDPFNRGTAPAYSGAGFAGAREHALMRVAQVQLAVRAYTLEHGAPPPNARALVPAYLPKLPDDPFAPQPITYRLKQGKPLIYSLGPDGVDNGGTPIKGAMDQNSKGDLLQGGTR